MRTLLLISAITAMGIGPGIALADPDDTNGHSCTGTGCKSVYDKEDKPLPPHFKHPTVPEGDICQDTVTDEWNPWDGCILP